MSRSRRIDFEENPQISPNYRLVATLFSYRSDNPYESIHEFPDTIGWRTCQRCADAVTIDDNSTLTRLPSIYLDRDSHCQQCELFQHDQFAPCTLLLANNGPVIPSQWSTLSNR